MTDCSNFKDPFLPNKSFWIWLVIAVLCMVGFMVVKKTVQQLRGDPWVESRAGKGYL